MKTKVAAEVPPLIYSVTIWRRCEKMWPGNERDSYAPTATGCCGGLCNAVCSCLGLLCCCWICRNCFGRQQGPGIPLMAPPPSSGDGRLEPLSGPHSPFVVSKPPGLMDDRLGHLGGPHNPFGMANPSGPPGPMDYRPGHLGSQGPHSLFGPSNPPGPPGPIDDGLGHLGGPHSPFGPGPPGPPRPPIQDRFSVHPGPPHPHGPTGLPEPPRVPGVQPGLL